MKSYRNKTVVITGAGSGIGRALALAFANEGAQLALNSYSANTLAETAALVEKDTGRKPYIDNFDVADKDRMFAFAAAVNERFGSVDVVINNAGLGMGYQLFHEAELDDIERVISTNFTGTLYGCKAFIPHLLKQPQAMIVNIASIFGLTGIASMEAYVASKYAVSGLTLSMAQTYRKTGLKVLGVYPGGVATNIAVNGLNNPTPEDIAFEEKFLTLSPDSAARTIMSGMRNSKPRILIGAEARVLDVSVRMLPIWASSLINTIIARK